MTTPRHRPLVLAAALTAALTACTSEPTEPVVIVAATYSQYQALPDFDDSSSETTDAAQLDALATLLADHDLAGDVQLGEDCPGGRSTQLAYVTESGESYDVEIAGCERGDAGDAIDALVASWRGDS